MHNCIHRQIESYQDTMIFLLICCKHLNKIRSYPKMPKFSQKLNKFKAQENKIEYQTRIEKYW